MKMEPTDIVVFCVFLYDMHPDFSESTDLIQVAFDLPMLSMRGSITFCQRGPTSVTIFYGGQRIQLTLKAGHRRPTSETPFEWLFRWRAYDGSTLKAGLVGS